LGLAVLKVVQRASQPGRSYRGHLGAMLIKIFYACQDFVVHKKFFIKAIIKLPKNYFAPQNFKTWLQAWSQPEPVLSQFDILYQNRSCTLKESWASAD